MVTSADKEESWRRGRGRHNLLKHTGQFAQILRSISASVVGTKDNDSNVTLATSTPLPSSLWRRDYGALLLTPLRYVRSKEHRVWILSGWPQHPYKPFPFPTSEVFREGKWSHKGTWISTVCTHLFLGNALHLWILDAAICLPHCSQETFLNPQKIIQKNISTIFLFFAPLSRGSCKSKHIFP